MSNLESTEPSILDKLDKASPIPLAKFDAFPKLPSTYKSRSDTRGFVTLFVVLACILLTLNDVGEFLWGWPDSEFSVDAGSVGGRKQSDFMKINLDMVVATPCQYLSIDLRDAVGDRLYLNSGLRRDGSFFDIGSAKLLSDHQKGLATVEPVAQSRSSRGFFTGIFRIFTISYYRPKYKHTPHSFACRISGQVEVKKITANLHITTAGHGYASNTFAPLDKINLSHVIQEFSFGPYYPEIVQPLDYTYEHTDNPLIAYQYFLHVVPTTLIAPRSSPLYTNQYSVTHYTKDVSPTGQRGVPGIFFKFEVDPMMITVNQRTTSFITLLIRCVGVIGGVFVCTGYALRVGVKAVEVATGASSQDGIVAAEASGVNGRNLREKWGGGSLRSRRTESGRMIRQGSGWVMEGSNSPYGSYANTPASPNFGVSSPSGAVNPYLGQTGGPILPGSAPGSPYIPSPSFGPSPPSPSIRSPALPPQRSTSGGASRPGSMYGPGGAHSPVPTPSSATFPFPSANGNGNGHGGLSAPSPGPYSPAFNGNGLSAPGTPMYGNFPASPGPGNGGFPGGGGPPPRRVSGGKKDKED